MRMHLLISSVLPLALTSCATVSESWAPFPAPEELISFNDRWAIAQKTDSQNVFDLQRELVIYRDEIYKHALARNKLNWESSGATTYGGLAAVVGSLADQTGLMNTGAGLAALGLTNSTRYKFSEQGQIYVTALKKLSCIIGKVNVMDDVTIALAIRSSDPVAQSTASNFINKVVASVDAVRAEYTNSLLGLAPVTPSREEMMALANQYRSADLATATTDDPAQKLYNAAGETTVALATAIHGCT